MYVDPSVGSRCRPALGLDELGLGLSLSPGFQRSQGPLSIYMTGVLKIFANDKLNSFKYFSFVVLASEPSLQVS